MIIGNPVYPSSPSCRDEGKCPPPWKAVYVSGSSREQVLALSQNTEVKSSQRFVIFVFRNIWWQRRVTPKVKTSVLPEIRKKNVKSFAKSRPSYPFSTADTRFPTVYSAEVVRILFEPAVLDFRGDCSVCLIEIKRVQNCGAVKYREN